MESNFQYSSKRLQKKFQLQKKNHEHIFLFPAIEKYVEIAQN